VDLSVTDNEGCSDTRIFTGKAMLCNGSPTARTQLDVVARKLTIHYKNAKGKFKGKLKADKKPCRRDSVKVFRKHKGGGKDHIIGSDNTNSAGKWSLKDESAQGHFYVQVKQKDLPSGVPCLATKSKATKVG
jgi:hypothetical protein